MAVEIEHTDRGMGWKRLSSLPIPSVNEAAVNVYHLRLTEARRLGQLAEKKRRNSNGEVPEDFDWDDYSATKGISKSTVGENTLYHYASSYYYTPRKSNTGGQTKCSLHPRSFTEPASSLRLMEINSCTRNPSQKQHKVTKSVNSPFQSYHTRLKDLKKSNKQLLERLRSQPGRPSTDVPRPPPPPLFLYKSILMRTKPVTFYSRSDN